MIYDKLQMDSIKSIRKKVEDNSTVLDNVVNEIVSTYVEGLDNYVTFISACLADGEQTPTDAELDDFCLNLATQIYFAGAMCEQLGIRNDISKAIYREMYNVSRDSLDKGTIADKNSIAELQAIQEQLTNIAYDRAYKIVKSKVENAQELLSACKKVVSRRMQEQQLTNIIGGK